MKIVIGIVFVLHIIATAFIAMECTFYFNDFRTLQTQVQTLDAATSKLLAKSLAEDAAKAAEAKTKEATPSLSKTLPNKNKLQEPPRKTPAVPYVPCPWGPC